VRVDLLDRLHVDQRPDHGARLEPVGDLHRAGGLGEAPGERIIDAGAGAARQRRGRRPRPETELLGDIKFIGIGIRIGVVNSERGNTAIAIELAGAVASARDNTPSSSPNPGARYRSLLRLKLLYYFQ